MLFIPTHFNLHPPPPPPPTPVFVIMLWGIVLVIYIYIFMLIVPSFVGKFYYVNLRSRGVRSCLFVY